jgi:hypothetical protein
MARSAAKPTATTRAARTDGPASSACAERANRAKMPGMARFRTLGIEFLLLTAVEHRRGFGAFRNAPVSRRTALPGEVSNIAGGCCVKAETMSRLSRVGCARRSGQRGLPASSRWRSPRLVRGSTGSSSAARCCKRCSGPPPNDRKIALTMAARRHKGRYLRSERTWASQPRRWG